MNANQFTSTALLAAQTASSTVTGSAVDIRNWSGKGKMVLNAGAASAGTDPTLTVKLTHCATVDGTYADVTGAAFAAVTDAADSVQQLGVDWDSLHRYVKAVATIGGTDTPTFALALVAERLTK